MKVFTRVYFENVEESVLASFEICRGEFRHMNSPARSREDIFPVCSWIFISFLGNTRGAIGCYCYLTNVMIEYEFGKISWQTNQHKRRSATGTTGEFLWLPLNVRKKFLGPAVSSLAGKKYSSHWPFYQCKLVIADGSCRWLFPDETSNTIKNILAL